MLKFIRGALSTEAIEEAKVRCIEALSTDQHDSAWQALQPLLRAQRHQREVARTLIEIVEHGDLSWERALEILEKIHAGHGKDVEILGLLGDALEQARDIDMLNAPPPESELFAVIADKLSLLVEKQRATEQEKILLSGLATAARMMARQRDALAERACRRLLELEPDRSYGHYNFGLFLKTPGRFREGMLANQRAASLASKPSESIEWNLGICATGAGEGTTALEVWKRMGQKIEMGRFGLPEGRYSQCKVSLAERPLAERTAEQDDPGLEETIWIERLSPCHGIIRSVLYQDLGVDYGDVILIDGAPITYHKYGEQEVPVFPHLATLVRNHYQLFDFAGTQDGEGRIADASEDLVQDSVIYSHTENYCVLCAACWRDESVDHEHEKTEEKHVVYGRIAAPPDLAPSELLRQLDAAMAARAPCRIYVPDLCEAAGLADRAAIERRRFEILKG